MAAHDSGPMCAGPSFAQATSSFYWYGENDSTCWQTGQLGSPSTACGEAVGPGFLSKSGSLKGGLANMDEVSAGGSSKAFSYRMVITATTTSSVTTSPAKNPTTREE